MENKLTIETIQNLVEDLERMRPQEVELFGHKFNFIKSDVLTGMQVILKIGCRTYCSPDITTGEIKIIDVPDPQWERPAPQ